MGGNRLAGVLGAAVLQVACGSSVVPQGTMESGATGAGGRVDAASSASTGGGGSAGEGGDGVCDVGIDHGCPLWAKRFGGPSDQWASLFNGLATDPFGDIHIGGRLGTGADFGGGLVNGATAETIFVAKLDATGEHRISRAIEHSGGFDVAVSAGPNGSTAVGGYIIGAIDLGGGSMASPPNKENVFVGRYDPDGAHAWSFLYGGADFDSSYSLGTDGAGNVYVSVSAILFETTTDNEFLLKYDEAGRLLWKKKACDYADCFMLPWDVSVGVDRVVVVGMFSGAPDFGFGEFEGPQNQLSTFVAGFTLDGDPMWSRTFAFPGGFVGFAVDLDSAGNVYVTGELEGTIDFGNGPLTSAGNRDMVLLKLGADGTTAWSKRWGGSGFDYSRVLAVDPLGNVVLSADPDAPVDFGGGPLGSDVTYTWVLAAFDTDGNHVWSREVPFSVEGIASIPSMNQIVVAGGVEETIDIGTGPLPAAGGVDLIVAALSP